MAFVNTKEASNLLRITASTLRRWDKEGKINTIRTPSGIRLYSKTDINNIFNNKFDNIQNVIYCNETDEQQKEYLKSLFPSYTIINDNGEVNYLKRNGLKTILELSATGKLNDVVISNRDVIGVNYIDIVENILKIHNTKLTILDKTSNYNPSNVMNIIQDILNTK